MKIAEIDVHACELQDGVFRHIDLVFLGLIRTTAAASATSAATAARKTKTAAAASSSSSGTSASTAASTATLASAGGCGCCREFPNLQHFLLCVDFDDLGVAGDLRLRL